MNWREKNVIVIAIMQMPFSQLELTVDIKFIVIMDDIRSLL